MRHTSWATPRHLTILAGLLTTMMACQTDDPTPIASEVMAPAITQQCVDFGGLSNCAFGAATATAKEGAMDIAGLRTAGKDGVATFLPATRTFSMTGTSTAGPTTTEVSRAINQGEVISSMTAQHNGRGLALGGSFTGNPDATYTANLYKDGQLVGAIPNMKSNADRLQINPGPLAPQRIIIIIIFWGFDNIDIWIINALTGEKTKAAAPLAGACVWKVDLNKDADPHVTLPDGSSVAVDHVEMVENVTAAGSYPYMSFDRIDYSSNAGALHVTSESAK
jgi:hypothetical protein